MTELTLDPAWHFAVIGDPVAHSKSPQMQNAALCELGFGPCYGKLQVAAADLPAFVAAARKQLRGFNVTVPHKRAILPFLDRIDPEAELGQSVNTVTVEPDGSLSGASTDGYGLAMAIRERFQLEVAGGSFTFFGAGGAAQAAALHFALQGARALYLVNRTRSRLEALAAILARANPKLELQLAAPGDEARIEQFLRASQLVIQATSLGLRPDDPPPFRLELLKVNPGLRAVETIYHPTPFRRACEAFGLPVTDGRGMLLHQGARSLELWLGQPAPVATMRRALEEALCGE